MRTTSKNQYANIDWQTRDKNYRVRFMKNGKYIFNKIYPTINDALKGRNDFLESVRNEKANREGLKAQEQ